MRLSLTLYFELLNAQLQVTIVIHGKSRIAHCFSPVHQFPGSFPQEFNIIYGPLISDERQRQLHDLIMKCGNQSANISMANHRYKILPHPAAWLHIKKPSDCEATQVYLVIDNYQPYPLSYISIFIMQTLRSVTPLTSALSVCSFGALHVATLSQ